MANCITQRLGSQPEATAPTAAAAPGRPVGGLRLRLRVLWGKLFKRRR
jgi:hypothetical protein